MGLRDGLDILLKRKIACPVSYRSQNCPDNSTVNGYRALLSGIKGRGVKGRGHCRLLAFCCALLRLLNEMEEIFMLVKVGPSCRCQIHKTVHEAG